ncbi:MAG: hypothetical protein HYZ89_00975 [Candidatus Omnitrophica bacterium]|nr:hypothetical protein [Candidatus Omnitrophota bacterium]
MRFLYKERYLKQFGRFSRNDQLLIHETDRQIRAYYHTRQASVGLRIKHLFVKGADRVFEARISRATRVVWVEFGDLVSFALVGSHDEVRRYLRSLR